MQGLEVDFLVKSPNRQLILLEAKASRTVVPEMAVPILRLQHTVSGYKVKSYVVHRSAGEEREPSALHPGVCAISPESLGHVLQW